MSIEDLKRISLPSSAWSCVSPSPDQPGLMFVKVQEQGLLTRVTHSVRVQADFSWSVSVDNHKIEPSDCPSFFHFPSQLGVKGQKAEDVIIRQSSNFVNQQSHSEFRGLLTLLAEIAENDS